MTSDRRSFPDDPDVIALLLSKTDEEVADLLGCDLLDVIALRAQRATEPLPKAFRKRERSRRAPPS